MADRYRAGGIQRLINRAALFWSRVGVGPVWKLTTTGHRSGEPRTVPVAPIDVGGSRHLVAAYGIVGWVQNVRADPTAVLSKGGKRQPITLTEVGSDEAGVVLAAYYRIYWEVVGRQFDLSRKATVEDFAAVAADHPVFRIES